MSKPRYEKDSDLAPRPGRPVRGSTSGRPIMAALDLVGRRWVLRIIWELREAPMTFRTLQGACGVAPSVLNTRLAELKEAEIVEMADAGYTLSSRGRALLVALQPLWSWAESWPGLASHRRSTAARSGGR